jgi:biotin synthase
MYKELIAKLKIFHSLTEDEYAKLINIPDHETNLLFETAGEIRRDNFGNTVYMRGLIELTNYCSNDCYYCGIRQSNLNLTRYRLTEGEILDCCRLGDELGFKTFVLQGGEDRYFSADRIGRIIRKIKSEFPRNAITLSLGEQDYNTYKLWFEAGADRYLLRHETKDDNHYSMLHPDDMLLNMRLDCLGTLKDIGYQVGTGFMVGSPYQTVGNLAKDLKFIEEFQPEMVGIGPFISHHDTPFCKFDNGSVQKTLVLISILRIMNPKLLIPATTALGSLREDGREAALLFGSNVIMPNITPVHARKLYSIYDNKISTGAETAEGLNELKDKMTDIGYELVIDRGDYRGD